MSKRLEKYTSRLFNSPAIQGPDLLSDFKRLDAIDWSQGDKRSRFLPPVTLFIGQNVVVKSPSAGKVFVQENPQGDPQIFIQEGGRIKQVSGGLDRYGNIKGKFPRADEFDDFFPKQGGMGIPPKSSYNPLIQQPGLQTVSYTPSNILATDQKGNPIVVPSTTISVKPKGGNSGFTPASVTSVSTQSLDIPEFWELYMSYFDGKIANVMRNILRGSAVDYQDPDFQTAFNAIFNLLSFIELLLNDTDDSSQKVINQINLENYLDSIEQLGIRNDQFRDLFNVSKKKLNRAFVFAKKTIPRIPKSGKIPPIPLTSGGGSPIYQTPIPSTSGGGSPISITPIPSTSKSGGSPSFRQPIFGSPSGSETPRTFRTPRVPKGLFSPPKMLVTPKQDAKGKSPKLTPRDLATMSITEDELKNNDIDTIANTIVKNTSKKVNMTEFNKNRLEHEIQSKLNQNPYARELDDIGDIFADTIAIDDAQVPSFSRKKIKKNSMRSKRLSVVKIPTQAKASGLRYNLIQTNSTSTTNRVMRFAPQVGRKPTKKRKVASKKRKPKRKVASKKRKVASKKCKSKRKVASKKTKRKVASKKRKIVSRKRKVVSKKK